MFEISVERTFCAAHALVIGQVREPTHGHNWHVTVGVAGRRLDADALLVDFHQIEGMLREVLAPWENRFLNETPPFDRINPSCESVALEIAQQMSARLTRAGHAGVRVSVVRVTEAPGCAVIYRPGAEDAAVVGGSALGATR